MRAQNSARLGVLALVLGIFVAGCPVDASALSFIGDVIRVIWFPPHVDEQGVMMPATYKYLKVLGRDHRDQPSDAWEEASRQFEVLQEKAGEEPDR